MSSSQNSSSSELAALPPAVDVFAPLYDVVCRVDVMLGTTTMSVRECIRLRRDSVVRLSQSAGGDMQVVINGIVVAHGEVVIVDDSTAIRVTEVLYPPSTEVDE
jgi:flagellar motor switch protein FliN/FliY